jgi:endonuclease YncB( thermonuclease family)
MEFLSLLLTTLNLCKKLIKHIKSRKYTFILAFLLVVLGVLFLTKKITFGDLQSDRYDYMVQVIGISDGDSFTGLTKDNQEIHYRIYGIDAPEMSQPFSNEARKFLSELIYKKEVGIIVIESLDKYDREIVQVFVSDSLDVGAEMLKNGLAWHYRRFDSSLDYDLYEQFEFTAETNKIGLWSQPDAESPWIYRNSKK